MSIRIDSLLHTNEGAIHTSPLLINRTNGIKGLAPAEHLNKRIVLVPKQLVLPEHLNRYRKLPKSEILQEEIEYLIDELNLIASQRLDQGMGFRPSEKDKSDILLGKKAKELSEMLLDEPTSKRIQSIKRFLMAISLINKLEAIGKERHLSAIGLRLDEEGKRNVNYGNKAYEIAANLKISVTGENTKAAMEFIEFNEVIKTLEEIAHEKSRTNMGFSSKPASKESEKIEILARELANSLKENPDDELLQAAASFLELVSEVDEIKNSQGNVAVNKKDCYGYHCSFDKNYATVA